MFYYKKTVYNKAGYDLSIFEYDLKLSILGKAETDLISLGEILTTEDFVRGELEDTNSTLDWGSSEKSKNSPSSRISENSQESLFTRMNIDEKVFKNNENIKFLDQNPFEYEAEPIDNRSMQGTLAKIFSFFKKSLTRRKLQTREN